jgi:zinc protease
LTFTPESWALSPAPSWYVTKIYAVTPQQVSDAARQHLQDDQATIVVVGDRKVIEEQVKAFGKIVP